MYNSLAPLLNKEKKENPNNIPIIKKDNQTAAGILKGILFSTASFGIRSLFVASHHVGNGLIMSSLGPTTAAASSITTTIQTFTVGASAGFITATAVDLSDAISQKNVPAIGEIIRTSWVVLFLLGGLSSIAFLSTRYTLPLILERATAEAAADFFEMFAIGAIPDLLAWTNGQIIFKVEKNSSIPLLSTIVYRVSALVLSYYLAISCGYGARGVGLGASIGGWTSVIIFQPWFSRAAYKELNLYGLWIKNFCIHFKKLMRDGWKFALQRITEWANLTIIAEIVGAWSNEGLLASQPSVLMLTLCNLLSQGFSQASMMISIEDCNNIKNNFRKFEESGEKKSLVAARKLLDKNYKNFFLTTGSGLTFNVILAGALYFSRDIIIDWYVPEGSPDSTNSLAKTLLWINAISLIPDAIRIITGGVLRGWGDLLVPTLISLIIMTVIGVPAGYAVGWKLFENILPLFIARVIALALSAVANCFRMYRHAQRDEIEYDNLLFSSELLSGFDTQEFAERLVDQARLITLSQKVEEFGFQVQESGAIENNLFAIIAAALGNDHTETNIKKNAARHIRNYPHLFEKFFTGYDRAAFMKELADDKAWKRPFCSLAISGACNISMVIINSDIEPTIIFQQNAINMVFIGYDNNNYYLLNGQPNSVMQEKIETAKTSITFRERTRDEKYFSSGSVPSFLFKKERADNRLKNNLPGPDIFSINN